MHYVHWEQFERPISWCAILRLRMQICSHKMKLCLNYWVGAVRAWLRTNFVHNNLMSKVTWADASRNATICARSTIYLLSPCWWILLMLFEWPSPLAVSCLTFGSCTLLLILFRGEIFFEWGQNVISTIWPLWDLALCHLQLATLQHLGLVNCIRKWLWVEYIWRKFMLT